jgi:hypothetical protein
MNSFYDEILQKSHEKSTNEKNIIEIYLITVALFNILFRQKNVKIFVVFMKNLKIQLKKQENNKVINSKSVMSSEYHDFLNVFFKKKTNILSLHRKHDHRIKLKKNHESKHEYASLYNLSENELLLIKKYLKKHLDKEFIKSSTISYASLILFAKKSNEEFRFCVDYEKLNVITKKNKYFISFIAETIARLFKIK